MKRNEKGIPLIALIITIIVMLILVIVAMSFAMKGDLFKRANEGSAETEKHVIYDIIKGSMQLENKGDSTFKVGEIRVYDTVQDAIDALEDAGYERTNISVEYKNGSTNETSKEAIMTVIGKLGTWKYKITTSEIIIYDGDDGEETLEWYEFRDVEVNGQTVNEEDILKNSDHYQSMDLPAEALEYYGLPSGTKFEMFCVAICNDINIVSDDNVPGMYFYVYKLGDEIVVYNITGRHNRIIAYVAGNNIRNMLFDPSLEIPQKKWFSMDSSAENPKINEYTFTCPIQANETYINYTDGEIICPTYLERMRNSFEEKWYTFSDEEVQEITDIRDEEGWLWDYNVEIALGNEGSDMGVFLEMRENAIYTGGLESNKLYVFFLDDAYFMGSYAFDYQDNLQPGIWYEADASGSTNSGENGDLNYVRSNEITLTPYTGEAPFAVNDFDTIYCPLLLNAIIGSFGTN